MSRRGIDLTRDRCCCCWVVVLLVVTNDLPNVMSSSRIRVPLNSIDVLKGQNIIWPKEERYATWFPDRDECCKKMHSTLLHCSVTVHKNRWKKRETNQENNNGPGRKENERNRKHHLYKHPFVNAVRTIIPGEPEHCISRRDLRQSTHLFFLYWLCRPHIQYVDTLLPVRKPIQS